MKRSALTFAMLVVACGGASAPAPTPKPATETTATTSASVASSPSSSAPIAVPAPPCTTASDVGALSWSSDGKRFAAAYGTWARVYVTDDFASYRELRTIPTTSRITKLALSPDGKTLVTGDADGSVHAWECESGKGSADFKAHASEIKLVRFRPDGSMLLTADAKGARLSNRDGTLVADLEPIAAAAFSDDGKTLALARSSDVRVIDVQTQKEKSSFAEPNASFVAFTPGAAFVVTGGPPHSLRLWDVAKKTMSTSYFKDTSKLAFAAIGISHAMIDDKQGWLGYMEAGGDPVAQHRLRIFGVLKLGLSPAAVLVGPNVPRRVVLGPHDSLALGADKGTDLSLIRIEGSKIKLLQTIAIGKDFCAK